MVGKPPRKPEIGVWRKPDLDAEGSRRTPDGEIGTSPSLHLTDPQFPAIRPEPAIVNPVTPEQAISVSLMSSIADEVAHAAAGEVLAHFRIPAPSSITLDSRGVWTFKRREYVAVAENQFVQVVTDPDSGLFRATNARELKPSGPLLIPDNEGRFWHPLDSDGITFADTMSAQAAQLFHRMGRSVATFSNVTVARMLAVSGVNESILRDALVHDRPAPFLLEDTIRRFELDLKVQAGNRQAPRESFKRFQEFEDTFEADCDENTLRMRRVFPDLPKTAAQAIWLNTTAAERLHMHNHPGIPQTVAKEALVALRDIRLARVCEGIYLEAVSNPDSDRLVLHMIGNLAHWPRQIHIEIRLGAIGGHVLSALGDARSPVRHLLIRRDDGYVIQNNDALLLQGSKDLYSAVWLLLSPGHRQLLGVSEGGGSALKQLIRAQPLPSRQALSKLLGLAPLPVIVDSAAVQHRPTGGLRGGADNEPTSPKSVAARVRDLYPQLSDEGVTTFINERLKSDPGGQLTLLEKEFETLRQDLSAWCAELPPSSGESLQWSSGALADQRRWRQKFSENLQAIWQRKAIAPFDADVESFSAFIDFTGELPHMAARFEYVTELVLEARNSNVRLGKLLDSFPNLQYLILEKVRMEQFSPGIFQMRDLRHLILKNCALRLSDEAAEGLARIETLTLLRLDENPLGVVPHVGFMRQLQELHLNNTGLTQIPSGIHQLESLKLLDLGDNNIVTVREELFEIQDTQNLFVNLIDNPLGEASLLRINEYLQNASMDSRVVIRIQEPVLDDVADLSDAFDSGVESEND